jgi:hypothetical protein
MKQNLNINKAKTFKGLSGIYKITNITTGEFYIGRSANLQRRFKEWRTEYNSKDVENLNWFWENPIEIFEFELIEEVKPVKSLLKQREQYWVDILNPYYNKNKDNVDWGLEKYKGELHSKFGKPDPKRKPIIQLTLDGNFVKEWDFVDQVKLSGFDPRTVVRVCQNKKSYYKHKGYKWEYK